MPRFMVVVAGLLIAVAAAYGGVKGFEFTDLDKQPPAPPVTADITVKPTATPAPPPPPLDERTVRELARAEVRDVIPPLRRPAPAPALEPELPTTSQTPSEAIEPASETAPQPPPAAG